MTTELAGAATEFTFYFRSMVAALGDRPGWYGVFAGREPEAAHAYEGGADIPPWDVVGAVLHDLAAAVRAPLDEAEVSRARVLHRAAVAERDAAPGAESALRLRLEVTSRARDMALLREREAARALDRAPADPAGAATARLANILAWARDDRERAAARCDELRARLAAFAAPPAVDWFRQTPERHPAAQPSPAPERHPAAQLSPPPERDPAAQPSPPPERDPAAQPSPPPERHPAAQLSPPPEGDPAAQHSSPPERDPAAPAARTASWARDPRPEEAAQAQPAKAAGARTKGAFRPRGARFAGAFEEAPGAEETPLERSVPRGARFAGAPAAPAPQAETAQGPVRATPRGARFAGAPESAEPRQARPTVDPRWLAEARQEAARLGELRRTGQSGAAYVVICEAAEGPAPRLPYLLRELERTELAADVATLLWEVAALPGAPLAAAASELAAAGRTGDCRTLLHQAASRPPADLATIAGDLADAGRHEEAGELLRTLARARPPEDAAAVVRARPGLAAPVLDAAEAVSKSRRRDIAAALRRAGLTGG
ncbi:hypothetical protein [Streptomyces sp. NPDC008139]|uniref:hypothetical protein n=1 Tax=Streptomyces sp. NPDC008139 TaxID=3364814 RepID=UPI0036F18BA8